MTATTKQEDKVRILVADDEDQPRRVLVRLLEREGHEVVAAVDGRDALDKLGETTFDIVFTDVNMPRMDGIELLHEVKARVPELPVIVVTGFGTVDTAVMALREGAYDYLLKPVEPDYLIHRLHQALSVNRMNREIRRLKALIASQDGELIGSGEAMGTVFDFIARVARNDVTVLVTGETGTGKELVAREIHRRSGRSGKDFVAVNCGAISEQLLESELFGHKKGAFTGADSDKIGFFEAANGGTIFLDEVGEMSSNLQVKLLRVLQESEIVPVGTTKPRKIDVRVIAATNRELLSEVDEGNFREDLYYRLNVVSFELPPLRRRLEDVPSLALHFLERCRETYRTQARAFSPEALQHLVSYGWPGNVRQLRNVVTRAAALNDTELLGPDSLPTEIAARPVATRDLEEHFPTLQEMERRYIERVLERTEGNKSDAASILGIDRSTLYRKCKTYGF